MSSTGVPPLSEPPKGEAAILPHEKVFPIQIGSQLFRLSGASIASDAPSYFSRFFEDQLQNGQDGGVRTLYIDRDPETFHEILRHLQGYYVRPKDGAHFVKLFADAQFYSLPRLIAQLFECEIFIQIGDRHFQIPRDIFSSPGDSPNFFSLGFAVFFASPAAVFPGLEREGLLRPPSITPPIVSSRSGDIFAELLHLLRGYPVHIRDEEHRACLLRDCRYYHLRGLEQKLIPHSISYNLERRRSEITVRLEDVRPSGVTFVHDGPSSGTSNDSNNSNGGGSTGGWVHYARPFVDEDHCELIIEIGGGSTLVDLASMRAELHGLTKARVNSLCQVVANKMNLPTNAPLGLLMMSGNKDGSTTAGNSALSGDRIKIHIDASTDITLDGEPFPSHASQDSSNINSNNNNICSSSNNNIISTFQQTNDAPGRMEVPPAYAGASHTPVEGNISPLTPSALYSRLQAPTAVQPNQQLPRKRRRVDGSERSRQWVVDKGQWRLRVHPLPPSDPNAGKMEAIFVAVKLEAHSSQRARNARRAFIS
ncbi:hypothetical protein McanMca71_005372 [Microsporum canis]|uniref:Potassium channel tetramerisation-type BTB domain-containing protein n=1 Tax=Arthroderma otae (strain ATCC MYA-4605 / CBS 113480) TaxID=554155 RepID=C5G1C9_ARTOC|nr:conserved hypothetical protein [Microsporum canis CBS 113480]EEQ28592.1 conserved hypothetical protein [Microsporum canis CBS 113480]